MRRFHSTAAIAAMIFAGSVRVETIEGDRNFPLSKRRKLEEYFKRADYLLGPAAERRARRARRNKELASRQLQSASAVNDSTYAYWTNARN